MNEYIQLQNWDEDPTSSLSFDIGRVSYSKWGIPYRTCIFKNMNIYFYVLSRSISTHSDISWIPQYLIIPSYFLIIHKNKYSCSWICMSCMGYLTCCSWLCQYRMKGKKLGLHLNFVAVCIHSPSFRVYSILHVFFVPCWGFYLTGATWLKHYLVR